MSTHWGYVFLALCHRYRLCIVNNDPWNGSVYFVKFLWLLYCPLQNDMVCNPSLIGTGATVTPRDMNKTNHFKSKPKSVYALGHALKRKDRQGDCPSRHRETCPMTSRANILTMTTFPFQWMYSVTNTCSLHIYGEYIPKIMHTVSFIKSTLIPIISSAHISMFVVIEAYSLIVQQHLTSRFLWTPKWHHSATNAA